MQGPELGAKSARRLVHEIVLTYTLEGDTTQTKHTITLRRGPGTAGVVDGVVWSQELMERLGYIDAQPGNGRCVPVGRRPSRPEDGWERRGGPTREGGTEDATLEATAATMSTTAADCIWLHQETCNWISYCSPVDPL